jgi:hypothetical protein
VPPKRNVATLIPYEQRIMACALVSEVRQLLATYPNGYTHVLMNDESRTYVNDNGTVTFCKEEEDENEGRHFILNVLLILGILLCFLFPLIFIIPTDFLPVSMIDLL